MKTTPPVSFRSLAGSFSLSRFLAGGSLAGRLLLAAGALALVPGAAPAQSDLDVGVRSTILDKPDKAFGPRDQVAAEHGKVYFLIAVQPIPSDQKMVRPVDPNMLAGLVRKELDSHGFRPAVKGSRPDILITVKYGRAWLLNPYMGATEQTHNGNGEVGGVASDGGDINAETITGFSSAYMKQKGVGVEAKLQKAEYEKLAIKITAWENPKDSKTKPKQLWDTIVNVDDPDHRDLNAIAEKMLEAGAPYFDKEIKEDELDVTKPLPEGQVNVGTPEVVEPAKSK